MCACARGVGAERGRGADDTCNTPVDVRGAKGPRIWKEVRVMYVAQRGGHTVLAHKLVYSYTYT